MSQGALIEIDGSEGEGGGQVLRSALSLSAITGRPFRIVAIRGMRERPGLMRQHLTAVRAVQAISDAEVTGAKIGSTDLTFRPQATRPGDYAFTIGTAGSTILVAQTVLPALMLADGRSTILLDGGTHTSKAPPFDFLDRCYLPLLCRVGAKATAELTRPGFYPAGGGTIALEIAGRAKLAPIEITERGERIDVQARAVVANLPTDIARRELDVVARRLRWPDDSLHVVDERRARGPGNVLMLAMAFEHVTETFTGFGQVGLSAEAVAERAVKDLRRYLTSQAAIGPHLADQLLLPMALAGGGRFTTTVPTPHTVTNARVIRRFLPVSIDWEETGDGAWTVTVDR